MFNDERRQGIALFRYGLIAPVLQENVRNQMAYFREIAGKEHLVPYVGKRKFKVDTFKSWLRRYRKGGFEALKPKNRADTGVSRKITGELGETIKQTMASNPFLSCSGVYRLLIAQGLMESHYINEGTLRKYVEDQGLKENPLPAPRKKFEKEHINELWIADCMHGPYVKSHGKKAKTYLIAAIDDRSRMIVGARFFFQENSIALEIVIKEAISRFGLNDALYCDNGSLFVSSHLQLACARLGIALIHSKPYDSPSRGKIERFFTTVRQKFLPLIDPSEIQDIEDLNEHFARWLHNDYHKSFHQGIATTPMDRFMEGLKDREIKRVSQQELDRAFEITITRVVKNDATVSVHGVLYECPPEFIGKKIEIRYPSDKPEALTIYENDKPLKAIKKVNIHQNANIPAWSISFSREEKKND